MKKRLKNWTRIVFSMATLIIMMFVFVTATYTENEDTMVVIEDNSIGDEHFDNDNSNGGEQFEYASPLQRYSNKGKMLQVFRTGSTSSTQMVDEFFSATETLNNLDAADRNETVTIIPPTGYSGTSGHFNISDVIAVKGNYTQEVINPTSAWNSAPGIFPPNRIQLISANFTLAFRSNITSVFVDIASSGTTTTGQILIQGADTDGKPNGTTVADPINFDTSIKGGWDRFEFKTILDAGSYTIVLNQTNPTAPHSINFYEWQIKPDNGGYDNHTVATREFGGGRWFKQSQDMPLIIEAITYEDASDNPKNFTGLPPSAIDLRYNGIAVNNYDQIPMNPSITVHNFKMDTSIRFNIDWLESFANDANPFSTDPLAYNITDGALAYWNASFTASDLSSISYFIQDRVFNVTKETDWTLEDVLQNKILYPSYNSGSTFVTIVAGTITVEDTWTIICSAPNYVEDVWFVNPVTLENITDVDLDKEIGVKTKLNPGYTSSLNSLTNTLLNDTSDEVYSNLETPTSNPYIAIYSLDPAWGNGIYTIESFYNNGIEVGFETATLTVYTPTYLSQETEFTTSTVVIGDPVYFAIYYNDTLQNQVVTDASVIMSPDWTSPPTISYNSTHEFYQARIETSGALDGIHTITVNASRQFYRSQNYIQFNIQLVCPPPMDVTPPTTTIEFSGTLGLDDWYISDVTISLSATDDLSGVTDIAYSLNGVNWNIYTKSFIITTEGVTTVYYHSTDVAGNVETTKTATIKIDKSPPETKISLDCILGLEGWYVSDNVKVTLTATDVHSNVAQTAYSLDDVNWNIYTESFIITEGVTTVYYHSTDVSGNVEATKTESIKIDKTLPTTTLMLGSPYVNDSGTLYVTDATEFTLTATDAGSGVVYTSYRINGGDWIKYDDPFTLVGPDGTYHIDYNSTDTAGNIELTNTTAVILDTSTPKDITPPTTTLTIGEPKYVTDITYVTPETPFTLEADDDSGSGVYSIAYRIYTSTYDTGWLQYTEQFRLTSLTDGTYTIEFNSTDHVGNMETPQSLQVTLFSWNYVFTDSYGRGTILKINTEYEFFQFITPHKDYGIRKATIMRERVYYRTIIKRHNRNIRIKRIKHHTIYIKHEDDELRLTALANPKRDFCVAIAWEVQVGKPYFLKDKPGIR